MASTQVRRSLRLQADPNGRQYLANQLNWTIDKVDDFITNSTVQPHLQLWHKLCITGTRRCNEVYELINANHFRTLGKDEDLDKGFAQELWLACLADGDHGIQRFADRKTMTGEWTTVDVWARTAWRIVNSNKDPGQAFERLAHKHPEHPGKSYRVIVDLLCLAFHSIAFRGKASVYEKLINETAASDGGTAEDMAVTADDDLELDQVSEPLGTVHGSDTSSSISATTDNNTADEDFAVNRKHRRKRASPRSKVFAVRKRVRAWDDGMAVKARKARKAAESFGRR